MGFGRLDPLWKFAAAVSICLTVGVFATLAATEGTHSKAPVGPTVQSDGSPAVGAAEPKDSLGVRCGWISSGPGAPAEDRGSRHLGPCSGHIGGGMNQGEFVPFR